MENIRIAVIGLGYVGLPLAVEFAKKYPVVGFDIKKSRLEELARGHDSTLEVSNEDLKSVLIPTQNLSTSTFSKGLWLTDQIEDIRPCNYYIVTVPTPIDQYKRPDLGPLLRATETVSKVLKKGDIVIYESTVYPGCTEEECVPILEKGSGLKYNIDFFCGYSPERVNPGDKVHTITKIKKVTSGSTPEVAQKIDALYKSIIEAGTHLASSIKVAEAAKVIENAQRDINIAFVNELAKIFNLMGIDTQEVLTAAATKWNFLPFQPGLVGGHCIGVDPYYLTHKAQALGYHPEVILAGRRINDSMGFYVAQQVVKLMIQKGHTVNNSRVLILGITFKENCPDVRNTRVIDIINELKSYGCQVDVTDPWADPREVEKEYGIILLPFQDLDIQKNKKLPHYDAIVCAVAHKQFKDFNFKNIKNSNAIIYDVKAILRDYDYRL